MDAKAVEEIMRTLAPSIARLRAAWEQDLSDPEKGANLMREMAEYNESVDAVMPRLARAFGEDVDVLRARFEPASEYHAAFDGMANDYLSRAKRFGSLDPSHWVEPAAAEPAQSLRQGSPRLDQSVYELEPRPA